MPTYLIDYRPGGMGNALYAHSLYACNLIDLDLDSFFSTKGHSHKIRYYYNKSVGGFDFKPVHYFEENLIPSDGECILQVTTNGWDTLFQTYMAYKKYYLDYPRLDNLEKFNVKLNRFKNNSQQIWSDFYKKYKDEQWPECKTFNDIVNLPEHIQNEIHSVYIQPTTCVTENNLVDILTLFYIDFLDQQENIPITSKHTIALNDYLNGHFNPLKDSVVSHFGWQWDDQRANDFSIKVIKAQEESTNWLNNIKKIFNDIINRTITKTEFNEDWEKSILLAYLIRHLKIDANEVKFDDLNQMTSTYDIINVFDKFL